MGVATARADKRILGVGCNADEKLNQWNRNLFRKLIFWNLFPSFHKPIKKNLSIFFMEGNRKRIGRVHQVTCMSIIMMTVHFTQPVLLKFSVRPIMYRNLFPKFYCIRNTYLWQDFSPNFKFSAGKYLVWNSFSGSASKFIDSRV